MYLVPKIHHNGYDCIADLDIKSHSMKLLCINYGLDWELVPYMTVTVQTDLPMPEGYIAVKNYSENKGIEASLIEADIIEEEQVGSVTMPYCAVPVYKVKDKHYKV